MRAAAPADRHHPAESNDNQPIAISPDDTARSALAHPQGALKMSTRFRHRGRRYRLLTGLGLADNLSALLFHTPCPLHRRVSGLGAHCSWWKVRVSGQEAPASICQLLERPIGLTRVIGSLSAVIAGDAVTSTSVS